jgi:hypothetical protein
MFKNKDLSSAYSATPNRPICEVYVLVVLLFPWRTPFLCVISYGLFYFFLLLFYLVFVFSPRLFHSFAASKPSNEGSKLKYCIIIIIIIISTILLVLIYTTRICISSRFLLSRFLVLTL